MIVADDGSSDDSAEVAASFDGPLQVKYVFQEDLGYRAGAARNAGARQAAAPILAFLDCGTLAGPGFVGGHLAAHSEPGRRAVVGYCFGYNVFRQEKWVPAGLGTASLAEVVRLNADEPLFQDLRHVEWDRVGFDPMKFAAPWFQFSSMNCSVRAAEFWAVGGFDEIFKTWGIEDVELGYRLYRNGLAITLSRDAWTIELPGDGAIRRRLYSLMRNAQIFLDKFREPFVELYAEALLSLKIKTLEPDAMMVARWTEQARELDVAAEIESAVRELPGRGERRGLRLRRVGPGRAAAGRAAGLRRGPAREGHARHGRPAYRISRDRAAHRTGRGFGRRGDRHLAAARAMAQVRPADHRRGAPRRPARAGDSVTAVRLTLIARCAR